MSIKGKDTQTVISAESIVQVTLRLPPRNLIDFLREILGSRFDRVLCDICMYRILMLCYALISRPQQNNISSKIILVNI